MTTEEFADDLTDQQKAWSVYVDGLNHRASVNPFGHYVAGWDAALSALRVPVVTTEQQKEAEVTDEMVAVFKAAWEARDAEGGTERSRAGLEAVLRGLEGSNQ